MGFFGEGELGSGFAPYRTLETQYGLLPSVFRAQSLLPRLIESEAGVIRAVLAGVGALSPIERERILLAVAAAYRNPYWVALQWRVLRGLGVAENEMERVIAGRHATCLSSRDGAVIDFALKLSCRPDLVGRADIDSLRTYGFDDPQILEAAVATALARCLCLLAAGTGATTDCEPRPIPTRAADFSPESSAPGEEAAGPYLALPEVNSPELAYFADNFGFVPNVMAAQAGNPELLSAQVAFIKAVLAPTDILSRLQKESIFIAVSAANLSTYCVAAHCQMLRGLGVSIENSDQIAVDHRLAPLSEADKSLLDFALKLRRRPGGFGGEDIETLRRHGFSEVQVLEAVAVTALTTFFNTISIALGEAPDFPPHRVFRQHEVHRFPSAARPRVISEVPLPEDPDAELVAEVQAGNANAFEELVRRHTRRVFRTLVGILGDPEEAQDAAQEAFLKAYQHIRGFHGRSKFSTWLLCIANNAGVQRLRDRRPLESLEETGGEDGFRPRLVQSWQDDPEEMYSKAETRRLVEQGIMRLPAPYRLAVMLRDVEQLSNEEAAAVLNLSLPGFKARVVRGRSMLRETLAPFFVARERRVAR